MEEIKTETSVVPPTTDSGNPETPSQKTERTDREKAEFNLKRNAERLLELGGDPDSVLGRTKIPVNESLPDETPLTVGALREFNKQEAHKSALQLAEDIEDEDERNDTLTALRENIKPSGDSKKDLNLARAIANSTRTAQIATEIARKTKPSRTAPGGSAGAKVEDTFEATEEELNVFKLTPNISPERKKTLILEARRKTEAKG